MRTHNRYSLLLPLLATALSCGGDGSPIAGPDEPIQGVLLKDIVIPNLPSPFYHFEYDEAGKVTFASFASGLNMYDVEYDGARIREMRNNIVVNHDRLVYSYDNGGRVSGITYVDAEGTVYTRLWLTYTGGKLTGIERERRIEPGFVVDRTMSLSYGADGNLLELAQHYAPIAGRQDEATYVDRFEQYDAGINVDGFSLLHNEFFDHLVLLPGVQLQKGNPRLVTRSGDGINYRVEYEYSYDGRNRPLTKTGQAIFLNGPDAGEQFQTNSVFSYH